MSDATIGILACLATVLLWTIGTFSFASASRLASPSAVNRVRLLYALVMLTFITCITESVWPWQLVTGVPFEQLLWFGLSGFIGFTIGDYLSFTAFRILGGRRTTLFNSIAPAAALLTGMMMLDEHLSMVGIIGMGVSVSGILTMSFSRTEQQDVHDEGHGHFMSGAIYAFVGAACQGIGLVLSKKGFGSSPEHLSAFHATWIRLSAAVLSAYGVGMFKVNVVHELHELSRKAHTFRPLITGTIVGPVLGVSSSLLAVSKIEASVAQTILAITPVSVTIISALLYKERIKPLSYVAVLICIGGVILLVWRDAL